MPSPVEFIQALIAGKYEWLNAHIGRVDMSAKPIVTYIAGLLCSRRSDASDRQIKWAMHNNSKSYVGKLITAALGVPDRSFLMINLARCKLLPMVSRRLTVERYYAIIGGFHAYIRVMCRNGDIGRVRGVMRIADPFITVMSEKKIYEEFKRALRSDNIPVARFMRSVSYIKGVRCRPGNVTYNNCHNLAIRYLSLTPAVREVTTLPRRVREIRARPRDIRR